MKLSVVSEIQRKKGFGEASRMASEAHCPKGAQPNARVKIVHFSQLAAVAGERLPLQVDGLIDPHQAIRQQRSPHLIAPAFEAQRRSPGGLKQDYIRGAVVGVPLQEKRQVEDVRTLAFEHVPQASGHEPVETQSGILGIEEDECAYSENRRRALRFGFSDGDDVSLAPALFRHYAAATAIGQENNRHFRPGRYVPGDRTAAAENFVIHVRREHRNLGFTGLAARHGHIMDRGGLHERAQAASRPLAGHLQQQPPQKRSSHCDTAAKKRMASRNVRYMESVVACCNHKGLPAIAHSSG